MPTSTTNKKLDDNSKKITKHNKVIANYIELAATHLSKVMDLGAAPADTENIQKMYVHLIRINEKYKLNLSRTSDTPTVDFNKRLICRYIIKIWVATDGQLGCPDEALFYTLPSASHAFNTAVELLTFTKRHFKVQLVDKPTSKQLGVVEIQEKR